VLTLAAILILLAGGYFVYRRVEVRLVLILCGAALFALSPHFFAFFGFVASEMTNEKTIVPICSAMGFAHVLKATDCDRHLVRLLVEPLRRLRFLLIPGGVAVGYLVNTAIVSQTSTVATVGPVLLPLLTAAGISPLTGGATLLLGASMGGELFNPAAVELLTLRDQTGRASLELVGRVAPFNLAASLTATLVFWWMAVRWEERRHGAAFGVRPSGCEICDMGCEIGRSGEAPPPASPQVTGSQSSRSDPTLSHISHPTSHISSAEETKPPDAGDPDRVNVGRALIPLLPLAILFSVPHVLSLPPQVTVEKRVFDINSLFIAVAMLAGTAAAALTAPRAASRLTMSFFEGAGYAYTHIISLIIGATVFTEGLKAVGLINALARGLAGLPAAATLASVLVTGALGVATGSGMAPGMAMIRALVPVATQIGVDPVRLGVLAAVAAQLGRTMSPVAAVTMMAAALAGATSFALAKRVAPALLAGAAALLLSALLHLA